MRKGILILFFLMGLLLNAVAQDNKFPNQIMIMSSQRWTNNASHWVKKLVLEKAKSGIKYFFNKIR